jgi:flavodoxin
MKICIICHSESGNTRHGIQHLASASNGHLIEMSDRAHDMKLTRFLTWRKKARFEDKTDIEPGVIGGSDYDFLVFGLPVWAFKPTLAIHGAIESLKRVFRQKSGGIFNT